MDYQLIDVPDLPDPLRFDVGVPDADIVRAVKDVLATLAALKPRRRRYDAKTDTLQDEA